ncbi:I78 family peptidase inhibitor [Sphingomonas sp.]|jgi:hypothetical protein|uniref:I78 family peptidase inhibitor n=1 Tax=Sphingomonas sp. TaxID=28214 RepID=UPI002D7F6212|nr:I78 family peptidase inhibitor [Sphingomonas sp.]HEU0044740.1 I78 family peptidase inhibitor [Sphingomonas sp.]
MLWLLVLAAMPQEEVGPQEDAGVCAAGQAEVLVGERYRRGVPTRAKRLSGARTVRVMWPGQMVTMDFREDRINVRVDYRRRIVAVRCG